MRARAVAVRDGASLAGRESLEARRAAKMDQAIVILCALFGLCSSFSKIGPLDALNKLLIALLCVLIAGVFCVRRQPKGSYIILLVAAALHAVAFAFPVSSREGIATYFMFAFWVLFGLYLANNIEHVARTVRSFQMPLRAILVFWTLVTLASFALPMCYKVGWGGERYFTSFTTDSFEIAPVAMFMLAVDIVLFRCDGNARRALLLSVVPLACVFAAGTRTYLVIVLLEFLLLMRLMVKSGGTFATLALVFVVASVLVASMTNIGAKFQSAMLQSDDAAVVLEVFTNGRSEFWAIDMDAYMNSSAFSLAFGHGFSYVYDLNEDAIGMRLYAHNDFINILLNFGFMGILIYFCSFIPLIRIVKVNSTVIVCLLYMAMWLFNAFFNMLYVYVAAVIGMGFIAIALAITAPEGKGV